MSVFHTGKKEKVVERGRWTRSEASHLRKLHRHYFDCVLLESATIIWLGLCKRWLGFYPFLYSGLGPFAILQKKKKDCWMLHEDINSSYTWKVLLKARDKCSGLIERKIANGADTSVWFDWIDGESFINIPGWQYLSYTRDTNKGASVLIYDREWCLDNSSLPLSICNKIQEINIFNALENDVVETII